MRHSAPLPQQSRAAALWLFAVALIILVMVALGGATRLTGSGLSITQWKPISGVLPPMSASAWMVEFRNYQQIPQFSALNAHMTLEQFKGIFWWEWSHRLVGRLLAPVLLVPLALLVLTGRLPRRLIWRCVVIFILLALQGFVGWLMVASGLDRRIFVAPEWLAMHLGLALILLSFTLWTALEAAAGPPVASVGAWGRAAALMAAGVYGQVLLGALVAGNHAGQVFNDWPLMNGRVLPADYAEGQAGLAALLHSQAAVQFDHRIGAYVVFAAALGMAVAALRSGALAPRSRMLAVVLAALVSGQVVLGVATLMSHAALPLSLAHQLLAAVVLATAVALAWRARRA